jgi:hypothetical protein
LRAENVLFRTYIGALAGASAVFRDMFALPQPTVAEGQEVYEGLPFVRLADTAFDVTQLLRSLHQLGCVPIDFPCVSANPCLSYLETALRERFSVVAAALRMGTKYDIPYLRQAAISKLDALCPSTLTAMRNILAGNKVICNYRTNVHIAISVLAKECDVGHLLPVSLLTLGPVSSTAMEFIGPGSLFVDDSGREYHLDSDSAQLCIHASWIHADGYRRALKDSLVVSLRCSDPDACKSAFRECLLDEFAPDPLDHYVQDCLWDRDGDVVYACDVCDSCSADSLAVWTRAVERTWNDLPGMFSLGTWEALRPARS